MPDPERLRRALSKLRPIEREVLILSAAEGLDNQAIAYRLGIDADTVARILADSLVKLDRSLDRRWWRFGRP